MKHTPGNWYVLIDGVRVGVRGPLNVLTVIASPFGRRMHEASDWSTAPVSQQQANARLIAAAPRMADILRRVAETSLIIDKGGNTLGADLDRLLAEIEGHTS